MSTTTPILGLVKPQLTDPADITVMNQNWDTIDEKLGSFIEDTTYTGCYYRMVDGVREWINPPMIVGVEYRTMERWEGEPVYTVIVDCGTTVANGKTQTLTNVVCGLIIRISGRLGGYTTPYIYEVLDSKYSTWATAHNMNGYLQVNTYANDDTGGMSAKIQVWYVK